MKPLTSQISNGVNLLPPEEKKRLAVERKFKLVLILTTLVLFTLVSFSLILLSIKFHVSGQAQTQKIIMDLEEEKFQLSEAQDLVEEIEKINRDILQLNSFYRNQPRFNEALVKISQILPSEVHLSNASIVLQSEKEKRALHCSLSGYSPDRETLLILKRNLEDEGIFREIDFPPASWLNPQAFYVSFKIDL